MRGSDAGMGGSETGHDGCTRSRTGAEGQPTSLERVFSSGTVGK